jgi:hypothetical protein
MRTKLFRRRAVTVYKRKGWKFDWQWRMENRTFTIVQALKEVFSFSNSNKWKRFFFKKVLQRNISCQIRCKEENMQERLIKKRRRLLGYLTKLYSMQKLHCRDYELRNYVENNKRVKRDITIYIYVWTRKKTTKIVVDSTKSVSRHAPSENN